MPYIAKESAPRRPAPDFRFPRGRFRHNEVCPGWDIVSYFPFGADEAGRKMPVRIEDYIMPPIPPPGIGGMAGCSDFFSARTHSVVRNIEAIDAAFSSATRDTFVGQIYLLI